MFAYETQSHHASKLGLDRCRLSRLCRLFRLCVCVLGHTRICINQLCVQMWLSLPSSLSHAYALVTCSMSQEHPVIPARVPKTPPTALAPLPHTHTHTHRDHAASQTVTRLCVVLLQIWYDCLLPALSALLSVCCVPQLGRQLIQTDAPSRCSLHHQHGTALPQPTNQRVELK